MIRMTTYNGPDDGGEEEFADIDALAADFTASADPGYAETVLSALRDGAVKVSVANGRATDVYEVIEDV